MILAIDIGNTTVALGGIRDGPVRFVPHMDTVRAAKAQYIDSTELGKFRLED